MRTGTATSTAAALLVAAGLLAACNTATEQTAGTTAAATAANGALAAADIRRNLIGQPLAWTTCYGRCTGRVSYAADGTAAMSGVANGNRLNDRGRWTISGSRLCVEWSGEGEDGCTSYRWRDGSSVIGSNEVVLSW